MDHRANRPKNPTKDPWKSVGVLFLLALLPARLWADVRSVTGAILFDTNDDGSAEAKLDGTGFMIGRGTASANLQVSGNAAISQQLTIGNTLSGTSNLNLNGSMAFSVETISSNGTLGQHSMVLADSSAGNLALWLPSTTQCLGRLFSIKKTSPLNELRILSTDGIDGYFGLSLTNNSMAWPSVQLIASANTWYLLRATSDANLLSGIYENLEDGSLTDTQMVDVEYDADDNIYSSLGFKGSKYWGETGSPGTMLSTLAVGSSNVTIPRVTLFSAKALYVGDVGWGSGSANSHNGTFGVGWMNYSGGNVTNWISRYYSPDNSTNSGLQEGSLHSIVALTSVPNATNLYTLAAASSFSNMSGASNGVLLPSGNTNLTPSYWYELKGSVTFNGTSLFTWDVSVDEYNGSGTLLRNNILTASGNRSKDIGTKGRFVFQTYYNHTWGVGFRYLDEMLYMPIP